MLPSIRFSGQVFLLHQSTDAEENRFLSASGMTIWSQDNKTSVVLSDDQDGNHKATYSKLFSAISRKYLGDNQFEAQRDMLQAVFLTPQRLTNQAKLDLYQKEVLRCLEADQSIQGADQVLDKLA